MKKLFLGILALGIFQSTYAQSLEKMQWFNEPEKWEIKDNALTMFVTAMRLLENISLRFHSR